MTRFGWVLVCVLLVAAVQAGEVKMPAPNALVFGGVAMAPARPLAELLGGTIRREGAALTLTRAGKTFTCTPGELTAQANGTAVSLPLAPFMRVGVTYVPLRALITAWGGTVTPVYDYIDVSLPGAWLAVYPKRPEGPPSAYRDDDTELFVIKLDGTGLRRLTYDTEAMTLPAFSADGSKCLMDIGGTLIMQKRDNPYPRLVMGVSDTDRVAHHDLAFSPDGRTVLYWKDGGIWTMPADPLSVERKLVTGNSPCFSPDGKLIAYYYTSVMLMDAQGGHRRRIGRGTWSPFFSRDGKMLYAYGQDTDTRLVLLGFPLQADGQCGEPRVVIPAPDAGSADLHPDGTQYAFTEDKMDSGIYVRKVDGSGLRPLTRFPVSSRPCYTPDGAAILFYRNDDLWIVGADGSAPRPLVTGLHLDTEGMNGACGVVSPNGKQLYFLAHPEYLPEDECAR